MNAGNLCRSAILSARAVEPSRCAYCVGLFPGVDLGQAGPLRFAPPLRSDLAMALSAPYSLDVRRKGRLNGVGGLCACRAAYRHDQARPPFWLCCHCSPNRCSGTAPGPRTQFYFPAPARRLVMRRRRAGAVSCCAGRA